MKKEGDGRRETGKKHVTREGGCRLKKEGEGRMEKRYGNQTEEGGDREWRRRELGYSR
jgi:hypothetical protein